MTCANVLNLLRYVDELNLNTLKVNLFYENQSFVIKKFNFFLVVKKDSCMKFLTKDTNFSQIIMMPEFEHLNPALMVEIIRLKQTPRKLTNADQMSEIIADQSKFSTDDEFNFFRFKLI